MPSGSRQVLKVNPWAEPRGYLPSPNLSAGQPAPWEKFVSGQQFTSHSRRGLAPRESM